MTAWAGKVEADAGVGGNAPALLGTAVPDTVEGFAEHGVMRLFAVEQEINRLADAFIIDLAAEILVNDLGPLFSGCKVIGTST